MSDLQKQLEDAKELIDLQKTMIQSASDFIKAFGPVLESLGCEDKLMLSMVKMTTVNLDAVLELEYE